MYNNNKDFGLKGTIKRDKAKFLLNGCFPIVFYKKGHEEWESEMFIANTYESYMDQIYGYMEDAEYTEEQMDDIEIVRFWERLYIDEEARHATWEDICNYCGSDYEWRIDIIKHTVVRPYGLDEESYKMFKEIEC